MENIIRCDWCNNSESMKYYHDTEWGNPSADDRHHFEHLALETFQAGLSWQTILNKRENFRNAFLNFEPGKIKDFSPEDVDRLLEDAGIIRNRLKIESVIKNAGLFLEIALEFNGFVKFAINFTPSIQEVYHKLEDIPPKTGESEALSKELKRRGFKFVGPTGCYAYTQSVGLVNDHNKTCFRYKEINDLQKEVYYSAN